MKAVLMAGGSGTRLRPLTCDLPKPMVPIINKPIIGHIVDLLKKHSFDEVFVTVYYLPHHIQNYLRDGQDFGVDIKYALEEEKPLGTAGCVKNIQDQLDDTFLVISGDSLTDFDLSEAIAFHKSKNAKATLVLKRVENPLEFGVVITDENGRIQRFLEKPTSSEVFSDTINTGLYILEPELLDLLPPNEEKDFSKDLFPLLLENDLPMYGYVAEGYWCDVGNLTTYRQAHYDVLAGDVKVDIPYKERREGIWIGDGVVIEDSVILEAPLVIGNNCYIGKNVRLSPNTILGDNVVVSQNASLKRPIVWNGAYVDRQVSLRACTLGKNVTIHKESQILEGGVIGDDTIVGEQSLVKPDVRIWPNKNLEANSTVTESIIWGSSSVHSLFGELGISGSINTDITPELVVKLGTAYGATLGIGKSISLSRDQSAAARIFSRAFASGVLSVGIHIQNLEARPLPVVRSQIPSLKVAGGVHIRTTSDSRDKISIEFLDANGLNIAPQSEKKIESTYYKEDFRRARTVELGGLAYASHVNDKYTTHFVEQFKNISIKKPLRIVLDYMFQAGHVILPPLLGHLGLDTVVLNAHRSEFQRQEDSELLTQTCHVVSALNMDLGVQFSANGEQMTVIDDQGNVVDHHRLMAVLVRLMLEQNPGKKITVPVMSPSLIEKVTNQFGGELIWSKSSGRAMMIDSLQDDVILGGYMGKYIFPQFHGGFDSLMGTAALAVLLSQSDKSLFELLAEIPPVYWMHEQVNCPTSLKGTIMRVLLEKYQDKQTSIIDGIKIHEDDGWLLILPDPAAPIVHLYADTQAPEGCKKKLQQYRDELTKVINKGLDQ